MNNHFLNKMLILAANNAAISKVCVTEEAHEISMAESHAVSEAVANAMGVSKVSVVMAVNEIIKMAEKDGLGAYEIHDYIVSDGFNTIKFIQDMDNNLRKD